MLGVARRILTTFALLTHSRAAVAIEGQCLRIASVRQACLMARCRAEGWLHLPRIARQIRVGPIAIHGLIKRQLAVLHKPSIDFCHHRLCQVIIQMSLYGGFSAIAAPRIVLEARHG